MRIVLSADMEGISQLESWREVLASCPEYWQTGRARYTADVVAAAHGLIDAGAREIVVLDNHASGHRDNLLADALPARARISADNVFDLTGYDGMLQVGYHPRTGVPGFVPHTYTPGLRLVVGDEEISESHGRAWAVEAPLLGITGHEAHGRTLGSLAGTPFLAVQGGRDTFSAEPLLGGPDASADAIFTFAARALRERTDAAPGPPAGASLVAVQADGTRAETPLESWRDARDPLAAAMGLGMQPFVPPLSALDLGSQESFQAQPREALDELTLAFERALAPSGP